MGYMGYEVFVTDGTFKGENSLCGSPVHSALLYTEAKERALTMAEAHFYGLAILDKFSAVIDWGHCWTDIDGNEIPVGWYQLFYNNIPFVPEDVHLHDLACSIMEEGGKEYIEFQSQMPRRKYHKLRIGEDANIVAVIDPIKQAVYNRHHRIEE